MDRTAVFVDAGYLFAQGSILIAGTKLRRGETVLDEGKALAFLKALSSKVTSLPLLRIYWYDGTASGPTAAHTSLAFQPDLKVRLGIVNAYGEQKGVDSLIVSDLINLSRNRAMSDAILITGDEDIRVGVQQAQEVGVRVHLVGIEHSQSNQSNLLRQEADSLYEISKGELEAFLTRVPPLGIVSPTAVSVAAVAIAAGANPVEAAAEEFAAGLSTSDLERVLSNPTGAVPPDIDRQLLRACAAVVKGSLTDQEKRDLRRAFVKTCKARPS